jgi:NADH-dependent peroxiredoxin subunit F
VHELIILGAGPAGMTAGVYAARKQIDTLIISDNVGGQTLWSSDIENYPGFTYVTGTELVEKFEDHLRHFNMRQEYTRVTKLYQTRKGFRVETEDMREFDTRMVIIATGKSPRMLNVPGEREFRGRGVNYCATCDAPLFAGMEVAVIGGGNSGLDAALQLMKITPKVYLIERTDKLRADEILQEKIQAAPNVEILLETAATEVMGDVTVSSLAVRHLTSGDRRELPVRGIFVEIGLAPNTDFLDGLLELNEFREIPINCAAETEVPGLFAAGDVTDVPEKQIVIAAGEGAKAALRAYAYLIRLPAVPPPAIMRPAAPAS